MNTWINAGRGIRYREHATRKHGQRPDRYWCIRYKTGGRYATESVGWWSDGISKADCEAILGEVRRNQRLGQGPQTLKEMRAADQERRDAEKVAAESRRKSGVTLGDFWEREHLPHIRLHKAPGTVANRAGVMRNWLSPLKDRPLRDITEADLTKIVGAMAERNVSPSHITKALRVFSVIWNNAKKLDLVSGDNPASKVKKPRYDDGRIRFLSEAEAVGLLEALKGKNSAHVHDAALLALYTGLRAKECTALTWADIDFDNGTIFVKTTKNSFDRHAFINSEIREMLLRRFRGQAKSGRVFPGQGGGEPYSAISKMFHQTVEEIGLNEGIDDRRQAVVFHTLRHTFASWLVKRGHPLYTVGKLLGHKTATLTNRYAHLALDTQRAAASQLEGFLNFGEVTDHSDEGK